MANLLTKKEAVDIMNRSKLAKTKKIIESICESIEYRARLGYNNMVIDAENLFSEIYDKLVGLGYKVEIRKVGLFEDKHDEWVIYWD